MPGLSATINNQRSTIQKVVSCQGLVVSCRRWRRGFTLIELLIVIAILGILATIAIAGFTSAQAKARDGRRKTDLDALRKAFELAKNDSVGSASYPGCDTATPCTPTGTSTNPDLSPTYIRTVPADPSGGGSCTSGLFYCYNPGCTTNYCTKTYTLTACLENANEQVGGNVSSVASTRCTSTKLYTVTEP